MREKRNDQQGEVVGLQYFQGDQEEENHSMPAEKLFNCESSQEVEESNAEVAAGQTSRSDNVPLAQSLPTVPKEPEKATGYGSTSGTISKAVSESTGQNPMTKIVSVQPSEKETKARSLFEVFIGRYIYVTFFCNVK